MPNTAFEAITTRSAMYAAEAIDRYEAVEINADGKLSLATGALPFLGIAEYGAEAAGKMCTAVRGIFPGIVSEDVLTGDYLIIDSATPGAWKKAGAATVVIGIALSDATDGSTCAVHMLETPFTTAQ